MDTDNKEIPDEAENKVVEQGKTLVSEENEQKLSEVAETAVKKGKGFKFTKKNVAILAVILVAIIALGFIFGGGNENTDVSASGEVTGQEETKKKNKNNGDEVQIPDLSGCDEDSAKTLLLNLGLVPVFDEDFSDEVNIGLVAYCSPECLSYAAQGSKVTVYLSKGATYAEALSSKMYHDSDEDIFFDFYNPVFKNNSIVIDVSILLQNTGANSEICFSELTTAYINSIPINNVVISGEGVGEYVANGTVCLESINGNYVENYAKHSITFTIPMETIKNKRPTEIVFELPYVAEDYDIYGDYEQWTVIM